jgi:Rod binding domain-containing protein
MNPLSLMGVHSSQAGSAATPNPKLVTAAHEFEAQMMKELLKPMTSNDGLTGSDDDDSGLGSAGALGEYASEALGRSLSDHGGLGIANRIVSDLSRTGNKTGAAVSQKATVGAQNKFFSND